MQYFSQKTGFYALFTQLIRINQNDHFISFILCFSSKFFSNAEKLRKTHEILSFQHLPSQRKQLLEQGI